MSGGHQPEERSLQRWCSTVRSGPRGAENGPGRPPKPLATPVPEPDWHAPPSVSAFPHRGDHGASVSNRAIERRGEVPVLPAQLDILLNGPPALHRGDLEEVLPRPRRGVLLRCGHGRLLLAWGSTSIGGAAALRATPRVGHMPASAGRLHTPSARMADELGVQPRHTPGIEGPSPQPTRSGLLLHASAGLLQECELLGKTLDYGGQELAMPGPSGGVDAGDPRDRLGGVQHQAGQCATHPAEERLRGLRTHDRRKLVSNPELNVGKCRHRPASPPRHPSRGYHGIIGPNDDRRAGRLYLTPLPQACRRGIPREIPQAYGRPPGSVITPLRPRHSTARLPSPRPPAAQPPPASGPASAAAAARARRRCRDAP